MSDASSYGRAVGRYQCLIDMLKHDKALDGVDYAVVDQLMVRLNGWPPSKFYPFEELYGDDIASWLDSPYAYAIYKVKLICTK